MLPGRHLQVLRYAVIGLVLAGCEPDTGPDLIFHGGPILTVDANDDVVEAIAIRDGIITAVGSDADIMALRTVRTQVHELAGHTLLPGFVAAHEHPTMTAVFGGAVDVSGFTHHSNTEVWAALRAAVATTPKGEWIYAMGIDPILVPDLRIPSRTELDALAPDHPVVLVSQFMHSYWANSRAFAEAGIDRNTPDPGRGAFYGRDASGALTGFVAEGIAAAPLLQKLRSPWRLLTRYRHTLDDLVAHGYTSVASLGFNVPPLLARFAASDWFHPRIRQFFYLAPDELGYLPDRPDTSNPYFRIQGIKLWHDGSPYTGSMYTQSAYQDSPLARTLGIVPDSHGAAMIDQQELAALLRKYTGAGWQVAIHSQGDLSNREVAQAIAGLPPRPATAAPIRIEHAIQLPLELMPELARLNVSPSFHINHIYYYGDALAASIFGAEAAQQLLPVKRAFELDMHPTLHADSPMFPAEPFSLMKTAVLRQTRSGAVLGKDQAISIQQAIAAMTINGAFQLGMQKHFGSIEPGKWADLQVIDRNPYQIAAEQLEQIRVLEVFLMGRSQHLERL